MSQTKKGSYVAERLTNFSRRRFNSGRLFTPRRGVIGFQCPHFNAFEFFSKTVVPPPHDVTDDVEQDVDGLLGEERGVIVHPRRCEPAEIGHEEDHEAARAMLDAKPESAERKQG